MEVSTSTRRYAPNRAFSLTPEMKKLLEIVKKKVPHAN